MRRQAILCILSAVMFAGYSASAVAQFGIPVGNQQTTEEVRSRDGVSCRTQQAQSTIDAGVTQSNPSVNQGFPSYNPYGSGNQVYARISVPLGNRKSQVNCNRLYELEIERLKHELDQLKKSQGVSVKVD